LVPRTRFPAGWEGGEGGGYWAVGGWAGRISLHYCIPLFTDRMRVRKNQSCQDQKMKARLACFRRILSFFLFLPTWFFLSYRLSSFFPTHANSDGPCIHAWSVNRYALCHVCVWVLGRILFAERGETETCDAMRGECIFGYCRTGVFGYCVYPGFSLCVWVMYCIVLWDEMSVFPVLIMSNWGGRVVIVIMIVIMDDYVANRYDTPFANSVSSPNPLVLVAITVERRCFLTRTFANWNRHW